MTAPINKSSNQPQDVLDSKTSKQKEKIDTLSQKQLEAKKITEEIAAEYPLTAKLLTSAAEQCEIASAGIEKIKGSQLEVEQTTDQVDKQAEHFRVLVKNANPLDLLEAIDEDLLVVCQKLTSRCSELQANVDRLEKAVAHTRQNRLTLLGQIELLKSERKELV